MVYYVSIHIKISKVRQYLVPQFITVEPVIFGPLTIKQFIFIVVGVVFLVIAFRFSDLALFIVEAIIIVPLIVLFGFIKINGRPFYFFVLNVIKALIVPSIKIWDKDYYQKSVIEEEREEEEKLAITDKRVETYRLSDLSLLLDTGGAYRGKNK